MALQRIETDAIEDDAVTTAKINADAVDETKIADDAVNSEHLVDGGVDDAHLATDIDAGKLINALPILDGSNLTGISPTKTTVEALGIELPAANLTGTIATARLDVGTTSNKLVQLDGSASLPAVDGSSLTGLPASVASYVQFPATQVNSTDANRLDEYEEGTWTISLLCGSGTATVEATSSYRLGGYIRIGRMVFLSGFPYVTAVSSPSGSLDIEGLPFTGGDGHAHITGLPFTLNSTIANSPIPSGVSCYMYRGYSRLRVVRNGTTSSNNTAQYLAVGSYLYVGGGYYTATA